MNSNETVDSSVAFSASIGRNASIMEGAEAHGNYTVTCIGPIEDRRDEYFALRTKLEACEEASWWKFWLKIQIPSLLDRIDVIPMEVKWSEEIENLVVTVGKNYLLDTFLAGSSYTAAWYIGLVDGASAPSYAAADTMASHAGWSENQGYSQSTRQSTAWSAASAGSKALSSALAYSINASSTIAGCFMSSSNTKGGTTGTLYSAGNFTGGSRIVASGDTLNVNYSASV